MLMEARLPLNKLNYLSYLLGEWDCRTHCTQPKLEELTGYLMFCAQVIPYARAFMRSLFNFSASFNSCFARRRITRSARRDLKWWLTFASA